MLRTWAAPFPGVKTTFNAVYGTSRPMPTHIQKKVCEHCGKIKYKEVQ